MSDSFPYKLVIRICDQSDLPDAIEAIDVWQDEQHCQVPIRVSEVLEADGGEWDMVREDAGRRGVSGEELDVQCVGGIDRDHAFAVVIQVLEEDLA